MKDIEYKLRTPIKPTLRPNAQDIATTGLAALEMCKASIQSPAGDLAALAMALHVFELEAEEAMFDKKLADDAVALGKRMAIAYHSIQQGIRAREESKKTGLIGLDGQKMKIDQPLDLSSQDVAILDDN